MRLVLTVLLSMGALSAAPGCDPGAEARTALAQFREKSSKMTLDERRQHLDGLAAKYPAAYEIHAQRMSLYRWTLADSWPAVRGEYVKRAEQNTDDPAALTLAAAALHRTDTPRAIRLLEKVRELDAAYPWSALKLAEIHQAGKFENKDKARRNFEAFAAGCADRMPGSAEWVMGKVATSEMQASIARALRTRLDRETDPKELLAYEMLWGLEFRTRPPQEHPAVREQVAKDVARLQQLEVKPDSRWMALLLSGVKQSGASKEAVTAFEDLVLKEAPASYSAYTITYERWKKDHKEPEDHKDTAAWDAWNAANRAAMKEWAARFTEAEWLRDSYMRAAVEAGEISENEATGAMEESINRDIRRSGPSMWAYVNPANALLKKAWAPKKTVEWFEKAWPLAEAEDRTSLEDDTLTDERRKELTESEGYRGYVSISYLKALRAAGKKEIPPSLRVFVEGPLPAKTSAHSSRYWAKARLAAIDGQSADALTFYQASLFTREKQPKHFRGKLEDELLDEAKSVFQKTGGTENAFLLWSKPPAATQELSDGRWEKPKKNLPAFELADLSGKTWKLKQLEGKSILINLWATWCGPCRSELPHFQKLYEKLKDRSDVQVISFNVDEELGLVEPYVKEQKFTFPVLPAYSLIRGLFDGYAIPQNWLVDAKGNWIATQIGFDASDTDWVGSMTKRLIDAREGRPPAGMTE